MKNNEIFYTVIIEREEGKEGFTTNVHPRFIPNVKNYWVIYVGNNFNAANLSLAFYLGGQSEFETLLNQLFQETNAKLIIYKEVLEGMLRVVNNSLKLSVDSRL